MFLKGGFGKAQCAGPDMGHHNPFAAGKCGPGAFLSDLNLSEDQLLSIAALKGKALSKIAHTKLDMMELKKSAFKELLQPQVDRAKIKELADQIKAQKAQCVDLMSENLIAFSEVLSVEQKSKLKLNIVRKFLGVDEILEDEEI